MNAMDFNSRPLDLIGAGEILLDMIPVAEAPAGKELRYTAHPGGSAFNTIVMASRLGLACGMIAKVGDDPNGRFLRAFCEDEGVSTAGVQLRSDLFTSLAFAEIDPSTGNSSYSFVRSESESHVLEPRDVPGSLLKTARVFHFASMFGYEDGTHKTIENTLRETLKKKVLVSFDPNVRLSRITDPNQVRRRILNKLPYVDLLKLSQEDMAFLIGTSSPTEGLTELESYVRGHVVLTMGEAGAACLHDEKLLHVGAFPVEVKDTIGAGDAFMAGLLLCLCHSADVDEFYENLPEAVQTACAVGALACTGQGALAGVQDLDQLVAFINANGSDE